MSAPLSSTLPRVLRWARGFGVVALMAAGAVGSADAQVLLDDTITLDLPIDCAVGKTCWVTSYLDVDPGAGVKDYVCGGVSYEGHKGVDIGVGTMGAADGVAVLASAPGRVVGMRDKIPDINSRADNAPDIDGVECGNGVMIEHAGGWSTQYCHMRMGSVRVAKGDDVKRGEVIGMVGLSGKTEHPHIHMTLRKNGTVVDPFTGQEQDAGCGGSGQGLWSPEAREALAYKPVVVYNLGFADRKTTALEVRSGAFDQQTFSENADALLLYVDLFGVERGDVLRLEILTPDRVPFAESQKSFDKKGWVQWFGFVGKKRGGDTPWQAGTYTGIATIERPGTGVIGWREVQMTVGEGTQIPPTAGGAAR